MMGMFNSRALAAWFSVGLLAFTLSPVTQNWSDDPEDGFPLSHYPMFTNKRGRTVRISYVRGFDADGGRHVVRYSHIGRGGFNQVRRQLKRIVREREAEKFCPVIAERIASRARYKEVEEIRILTGTFDIDGYFAGNTDPEKEKLRASCPVVTGGL